MKNSFYLILIFILIGAICVGIKFNLDLEDFKEQAAIEKYEQNKRIEELEKEIRVLKQDVLILEYGFDDKEDKE